jgi:hypothetical protein
VEVPADDEREERHERQDLRPHAISRGADGPDDERQREDASQSADQQRERDDGVVDHELAQAALLRGRDLFAFQHGGLEGIAAGSP